MSVCPWCKKSVPSSAGPCPLCGKNPDEHPSISSAGYASFGGFDDFDGPGENIQVGNASTSAAAQPAGGLVEYGGGFDDDDDGEQQAIKLDVEAAGRPSADRRLSATAPVSGRARSEREPVARPAPIEIDPYEIAVLADFGKSPTSLWLSPAYVWRVLQRKRALGRALKEAQAVAAQAEQERDERLVALAEKARPTIETERELAGYLQPLLAAEQTLGDREQALASRSSSYASAVGEVDARIATEQANGSVVQGKVDAARADHNAKVQELTRAQAALKRAEIELRNRQQLARAAAGPDARTAPPEHAAAILEAQRMVEQRRALVQAPQAEVDRSQQALGEIERQSAEIQRRIAGLRAERKRHEETFGREIGVRSEGVEQAQSERRTAFKALGSRLVDTNSEHVSQPDRDAFDVARRALSERQMYVERLIRAIGSADPVAVKRGRIVIGAGALVLLALFVVLFLSMGGSPPQ